MTEKPDRFSEKRMQEAFSAVVLFNGPLQFRISDVFAAGEKEFPELIRPHPDLASAMDDPLYDTAAKIPMAPMMLADECSASVVNIFSLTGGRFPDAQDTAIRSAITFPEAQQAWDDHKSYLYISAGGPNADLVDRFRAAQLTSAVAALFASDPTCVGVLFPTGDVIVSPQEWQQAARIAAEGYWPLAQWISFRLSGQKLANGVHFGCQSIGMAAFNGFESHFAMAPVEPAEAASYAYSVCHMLLDGGSAFMDSDTMGVENSDEQIRIRLLQEGAKVQTDTWVLLHPQSPIDEKSVFGERSGQPPPPGTDNSRPPQEGFFQSLLHERLNRKLH